MKTERQRGHRAGLDPDVILAAARLLSAEEGVAALSMRRLADRLGVAPNSVYSYYPDKATLLAALMDVLLAGVAAPNPALVDWRDGLVTLLGESRRLLLAHAELIPLFLAGPSRGPNAVRLGEATLALLAAGGVSGPAAVDALQVLLIYTFGFAAYGAPRAADPARSDGQEQARTRFTFEATADAPRSRAVAARLAAFATEATFEMGVRWLLDGIAARGTLFVGSASQVAPPLPSAPPPQPSMLPGLSALPAAPPQATEPLRPRRSGRFL